MRPRDESSPPDSFESRDKFSPSGDYSPSDNFSPPGSFPQQGSPGSNIPPEMVAQKPTYAIVMSIIFLLLAAILFFVSKKFPRFNKLKWGSLVSIIVSTVLALVYFTADGGGIKAVKAPKIEQGRIIGVREPDISAVSSMLENDTEKLKNLSVNTISLSPRLEILPSGAVEDTVSSEYDLKAAINKVHKAGFQVYLELAPIKSFSYRIDNPSLYESTIKRLVTKYAKVAEEFNVAYFSPLSDVVTHPDQEKLAKFMRDMLPKIKKHYTGNVVYQKHDVNPESALELTEDHSIEFEFMITGTGFKVASRYHLYSDKGSNIIFSVDDEAVSVSDYSKGGRLFKDHMSIDAGVWHKGKILQQGKRISFYFNGEEMYSHEDDQKVHGSYAFLAAGSRVKNISIKDLKENPLIDTDNFANNWASSEGWSIEGNEFVGRVHPKHPENNAGELFLVGDIDYSGYDTVGVSLWRMGTIKSLEDFKSGIDFKIESTKQQAASFGIKQIIVSRFGGTTAISDKIPEWEQEKLGDPMTSWELADTVEAILLAEEGKTKGLIYDGWETENQGINKIPEVEQVIKRLLN